MPLATELGLGQGDIVLHGYLAPIERGTAASLFSAHVYCSKRSPISATGEHLFEL